MTRAEKISLSLFLLFSTVFAGEALFNQICDRIFDCPDKWHIGEAQAAGEKYTCGMHPMVIVDEPGTCPICGMELVPLKAGTGGGSASDKPAGERKIKYWQAPMDPTYIRNEPGKSPMGMDLIPVYEDEAPGGSQISIDPVTAQNMGIRTAVASKRDMSRTIRTVGLIAYDEPKQFSINSKIAGWVEKLYVNETGQFVKKGQKLLEIYSPELVSAQEEFLLALNNRSALASSSFPEIAEGANRLLESSRRRLQLWDISQDQIRRLEKTRKVEKTLVLRAPYDGIVNMKMVNEGMYVKAGMELFQISDISKVWIYADIYEYELPWVRVGQRAEVILPFVGEKSLTAKVVYIYPYVEPKTRTVKARLILDNPGFQLKPDMYVNVRLKSETVKDALAIPAESVLYSGEKQTVFIALDGGKFEPRPVKVGIQDDNGMIEIKQGVLPGDRVVTSAQFLLDSESQLREAIAKMLEVQSKKTAGGKDASMSADDMSGEDKPAGSDPAGSKQGKQGKAEDLF